MRTKINGWVLKSRVLVVAAILLVCTFPSSSQGAIIAEADQAEAEQAKTMAGHEVSSDGWEFRNGRSSDPDGRWSYNWGRGSSPDGTATVSYGTGSGLNSDGTRFAFGYGSSSAAGDNDDVGSPPYGGSSSAPDGGSQCACDPAVTVTSASSGGQTQGAQGPAASPTSQPWQDQDALHI
ncbi:hypothetical protein COLO4_00254 [Corchorus olitorius]|uniref:Uncharacterized protein n=1 Tax=Corchorus olitorius TaxID=93759 RepID=A0A1R3L482_9ROSI|nr:hypothetical protein COLO4_00254 [Corchorus olitorius]